MKKINIAAQIKIDKGLTGLDRWVLVPLDGEREKLKSYHENQILDVDVKGSIDPRSLEQLRLYWVCAGKVVDNSDFPTDKDVDEYVKKKCHYVEWFTGLDGKQYFRTKSIAVANCDQPDFNDFMDKAIPAMAEIIQVTPTQLINSQYDTD